MSETPKLRPNADVVHRSIDDETVLVNLKTNRIYALNSTGARFWELLASGRDVAEIRGRLLEEFDVTEPGLDEEIRELTARLLAEGLVSAESSS